MANEHLRRSQKQEREGARRLGGTVNSGSGNGWKRKNDVRTDEFSVEFKTTAARQYILKADDLLLAYRNALADDRTMLFGIEMRGARVFVIDQDDFYALLERLKESP